MKLFLSALLLMISSIYADPSSSYVCEIDNSTLSILYQGDDVGIALKSGDKVQSLDLQGGSKCGKSRTLPPNLARLNPAKDQFVREINVVKNGTRIHAFHCYVHTKEDEKFDVDEPGCHQKK